MTALSKEGTYEKKSSGAHRSTWADSFHRCSPNSRRHRRRVVVDGVTGDIESTPNIERALRAEAGECAAVGAKHHRRQPGCLRHIIERQLAVRAEDSDDDDDPDRTYAFPPPVDLDAYAAACRLPPAEETEDEREARFQRDASTASALTPQCGVSPPA